MSSIWFALAARIFGPLLFVCTLWGFDAHTLGMAQPESLPVLALALWMAVWWLTEAVPLAVTALLPLFILPALGVMSFEAASAPYARSIIFLFLAGFMLAAAIEKWHLHQRIALGIILRIGQNGSSIVFGFMLATALLSMWISNTATAIMMIPIALAMVKQLPEAHRPNLGKALMLGIAYAASIGGTATLIGTPTNAILADQIQKIYGDALSFSAWMAFALPLTCLLLVICWWYLVRIAFPMPKTDLSLESVRKAYRALGPMKYEEKMVLIVFAVVAISWITRPFILNALGPQAPKINDAMLAIAGVILLFLIPARGGKQMLMDWPSAVRIPWGILLLFGGGLSLAAGVSHSGLANWLGAQIGGLSFLSTFVLLLLVVTLVNFLTEFTSNVATISMIIPVLAALTEQLGILPYPFLVGATCAASCAFMLPVATAPNAVAFSSGYLDIKDMARAGFWMNLLSIFLFTLGAYYLLPLLWD